MYLFSNLAVFVSLILAVAISRGLEGMAYLIGQRTRVTWNWVFITWGVFFIVACAAQWWDFIANWRLSSSFSLYEFLFMLASPIVLFFLPAVLFHSFAQTGPIDLWAHFEGVRVWVYSLATVHVFLYVVSSAILAAKKGVPFSFVRITWTKRTVYAIASAFSRPTCWLWIHLPTCAPSSLAVKLSSTCALLRPGWSQS